MDDFSMSHNELLLYYVSIKTQDILYKIKYRATLCSD